MPEIHAPNNRKRIARIVFYVVCTMPIAREQRGKQALSTIQAVFSMGSMQSGYIRVEF
jgi:hypothetical protein